LQQLNSLAFRAARLTALAPLCQQCQQTVDILFPVYILIDGAAVLLAARTPQLRRQSPELPHLALRRAIEFLIVVIEDGFDIGLGLPEQFSGQIEIEMAQSRQVQKPRVIGTRAPSSGLDELTPAAALQRADILGQDIREEDRQALEYRLVADPQIILPDIQLPGLGTPAVQELIDLGLVFLIPVVPPGLADHHRDIRTELLQIVRRVDVLAVGTAADQAVRVGLVHLKRDLIDKIPDVIGYRLGTAAAALLLCLDKSRAALAFAASPVAVVGHHRVDQLLRLLVEELPDIAHPGLDQPRFGQTEIPPPHAGQFVIALTLIYGEEFRIGLAVLTLDPGKGVIDGDGRPAEAGPPEPARAIVIGGEVVEIHVPVFEVRLPGYADLRHADAALHRHYLTQCAGHEPAHATVLLQKIIDCEQRSRLPKTA